MDSESTWILLSCLHRLCSHPLHSQDRGPSFLTSPQLFCYRGRDVRHCTRVYPNSGWEAGWFRILTVVAFMVNIGFYSASLLARHSNSGTIIGHIPGAEAHMHRKIPTEPALVCTRSHAPLHFEFIPAKARIYTPPPQHVLIIC